ncbi:MAG TPA: hypothetical protein VFO16_20200 [Pseudonocardiaceae bacterium]|nr:hypothetical protein [Pseudonocardiaceae bacterium]
MGFARHIAVVTVGVTGSAVLFAGPVAAAGVGDTRLSGPGADLSVAIPTGWHQIADQADPQLLQMVYPDNCTEQLRCASAMARLLSTQAANAQAAAEAGEQAVATLKGVEAATVTSQGPLQIAGRTGYQVRFAFTTAKAKFQAVTAAVETGVASAGTVPTSLIFVTVSDLAGAPPAGVIDQIVSSAQLKAQ